MALALIACGMKDAGGPDARWIQVREETSCEALSPSYCTGVYGFTVVNDGRYSVGPADNGVRIDGSLTDSERTTIFGDAALEAGGIGGDTQCDSVGTVPGVRDIVDVTDHRNVITRVYDLSAGSTCYVGGRDQAVRLHAELSALMARYYPRPFPSQ